jgi:CMP/dCMP kinase
MTHIPKHCLIECSGLFILGRMHLHIPVLAIDGPSGSGKGTISRAVARALGWHFLDSGALYRVVGLAAMHANADLDSEAAVVAVAKNASFRFFEREIDDPRVILDEVDVTDAIRTETVAAAASKVAAIGAVRSVLLDKQRELRQPPGLVADGRDMGTVVFPDARLKIFLEASVNERAERRYKQLMQKGVSANLADLLQDLSARDQRDRNRAVAPLKCAEDAVLIDSTSMSIEQVFSTVMMHAANVGIQADSSV